MIERTRQSVLVLSFALVACGSSDADSPASVNPRVQRWCDQNPCGWDTPNGGIERVGSWHTDDYAAALIGDDAVLSQDLPELDPERATCLEFSLVADVATEARVFLEVDFLDDGSVEFSEPIPPSHWEVRTFNITAPVWYHGVRFIVRKAGPGHVVLGELRVRSSDRCTRPPIQLVDLPDGASCTSGDECAGGQCEQTCSTCDGGSC